MSDNALIEAMADEIAWAIGEPLHSRSPGIMLAAQRALAAIRKTHAVVQKEPSEAMMKAGIDAAPTALIELQPSGIRRRTSWSTDECAAVYRAMLAASQEDSDGS